MGKCERCGAEEWNDVNVSLPIVPENKYAMTVLAVVNDTQYAEACNCDGRDVQELHFCKETQEFEEMVIGGDGGWSFDKPCDPVTHWRYLPALPKQQARTKT